MQQLKKYFICAHTAKGMIQCLNSNLQGIDHRYALEHISEKTMTRLAVLLLKHFVQNDAEVLVNIDHSNYIDGIIIRDLSLAVYRKNIYSESIPQENVIVLTDEYKDEYDAYVAEKNFVYETAYDHFRKGLSIHEQLESIYIEEMDFTKANEIIEHLIDSIFGHLPKKDLGNFYVYERFFATNTPDGIVNYMEPIVDQVKKRYFLKGRAGTGKSYLQNKILEQCKNRNIDVELYRCSLDPNSIDMLVIGDNDFCIFDSTPPHELMPSREEDVVIDLYDEVVKPGTDEKYAAEIVPLTKQYKKQMQLGLMELKNVKKIVEAYELKQEKADVITIFNRLIELIPCENK